MQVENQLLGTPRDKYSKPVKPGEPLQQRKRSRVSSVLCLMDNILACTFVLLPFLLFLVNLYKQLFSNRSLTTNLPSPTKLPIIGNLHQIGKYPHRSLHYLSQQHGELMLLHFGREPVLVVSSARAARQIMRTYDTIFCDRPVLNIFKKLVYNCKNIGVAPYGDYWRQMRSICVLQLLSQRRVQSFHPVREKEIAEMIEEIKRSSTEVNLSNILTTLTSDLICQAAFGMKCNGEMDGTNFRELLEKHEKLVGGFYVGDFIPWLFWIDHLTGVETEIKKSAQKMDKFLEGIIQRHVDGSSANGTSQGKIDEKLDFVDILLEQQQHNTAGLNIDRDSIKAVILDMFVAGITTTFATMEWAMSQLLRNHRVMDTLTKEVRGIVGDKAGITDEDLEKMKYLKAVIKETLRLHPPAPLLLPHISMKEVKIDGYNIAARTQVIVNAWAVHRDPKFWEEPENFFPERFLNSSIDFKGQDFGLIPFGSGRRGCPGISFAIATIELALANLIYHFNWALPGGPEEKALDMTETQGLTMHRENPLLAIAMPHSP